MITSKVLLRLKSKSHSVIPEKSLEKSIRLVLGL